MSKTKFVLGLSMVVALFAFAATPALARWTNHGGKGAGKAGEGTLTYEGGTVKCLAAAGTYTIGTEGKELKLEGLTWTECKGLGLEAKITCEKLEMKQPTKEGVETGQAKGAQTTSPACLVKIAGACEITIPTEGNTELKKIAMEKGKPEKPEIVKAKVEASGITATAKGSGCALGGISKEKTTTATEKVPVLSEGVGLE